MAYVYESRVAKLKCLVCDGALDKPSTGNICNDCKDKMRLGKISDD